MNRLSAFFLSLAVVCHSHLALAEPEVDKLVSEVTSRLEDLHEQMWKIEDITNRRRAVGIAVGILAGVGTAGTDNRHHLRVNVSPILAGRYYFYRSDKTLAIRAKERLDHLRRFSFQDVKRAVDYAKRAAARRKATLEENMRDVSKQQVELQKLAREQTQRQNGCSSPSTSASDTAKTPSNGPQSDEERLMKSMCEETRQNLAIVAERTVYLADLDRNLKDELEQLEQASMQLADGEAELSQVRRELDTSFTRAEEAAKGFFLGGSFVEGFVGMGLNIYSPNDSNGSQLVGGLGYGLGQFSVGGYISNHFLGGYFAVTIPLFEH